jgi:hypothetical protein
MPGHDLPQFFRHIQHEIHDVFRLAAEAFPQRFVLGCNADGAGVQVAGAHHACSPCTSGAVAKPNSSAPSMQAMATSRPLISLPSVSR